MDDGSKRRLEALADPPVPRYRPPQELVARAQRALLELEDETTPQGRFIRQQWETALSATRVGMDALRSVWPIDREVMTEQTEIAFQRGLHSLEDAYEMLSGAARDMLGHVMVDVLNGQITTHEELDSLGVPR